jgi:hypothetical protein
LFQLNFPLNGDHFLQFSPDQLNTNKEVISHPWQIPASLNTRDPASGHPWNPAVDQFFYRSKRRNNLASNFAFGNNRTLNYRLRAANWTTDQADLTAQLNQMATTMRMDSSKEQTKIKSAKIGAKWPSVSIHPYLTRKGNTPGTKNYNPLPYGIPYSKSEGGSSAEESHGLPFARRPFTRSKSPPPLRLPIPDSEIHYRKPVNNSILRAYHEIVNEKYGNQAPNADWKFTVEDPSLKTTDVESFRVLIDVIKSLMESSSDKKPLKSQ